MGYLNCVSLDINYHYVVLYVKAILNDPKQQVWFLLLSLLFDYLRMPFDLSWVH
jgi:hypothetical protein